jgi:hypothetical protein
MIGEQPHGHHACKPPSQSSVTCMSSLCYDVCSLFFVVREHDGHATYSVSTDAHHDAASPEVSSR